MTVDTVTSILTTLTILCWVFVVGAVLFYLVSIFSHKAKDYLHIYRDLINPYVLPLAFLIALAALLGSLYYSESAHYVPCEYCWYQRIGIYPLSLILFVAMITRDRSVKKYVLPMTLIISCVSIWHILVQRVSGLEKVTACKMGTPCSSLYLNELGFISIPVMALTAALTIAFLMLVLKRKEKN